MSRISLLLPKAVVKLRLRCNNKDILRVSGVQLASIPVNKSVVELVFCANSYIFVGDHNHLAISHFILHRCKK